MLCQTTAELIKPDKEGQLQASNTDQIQKLVQSELQQQGVQSHNARQQFMAQLADIDEADEEDMLLTLTADPKPKNNLKASGDYPFPFANNKSKKVPPRPCRNCGNPLHYDL
jgi:hypothetical protein